MAIKPNLKKETESPLEAAQNNAKKKTIMSKQKLIIRRKAIVDYMITEIKQLITL